MIPLTFSSLFPEYKTPCSMLYRWSKKKLEKLRSVGHNILTVTKIKIFFIKRSPYKPIIDIYKPIKKHISLLNTEWETVSKAPEWQ